MDKNPTKKCPECQMEVSEQAKKCPYCQSKIRVPTTRLTKVLLLVIFIGVFSSIIFASMGGSSSSTPTVSQEDPKSWARTYAEIYIERLLKSPSTAEFCRPNVVDLGENKYKVDSCVDSQNSYGATLRSNWEMTMTYSGSNAENAGSWKTDKVIFDGKVVYQSK